MDLQLNLSTMIIMLCVWYRWSISFHVISEVQTTRALPLATDSLLFFEGWMATIIIVFALPQVEHASPAGRE